MAPRRPHRPGDKQAKPSAPKAIPGAGPSNRVAELRKAHGLSQRELAAKIPSAYGDAKAVRGRGGTIHWRTIDRWEKGTVPIPERHWHQLASVFSVSVVFLLGLDREADAPDGDNGDNGNGNGDGDPEPEQGAA